MRTKPIPIPLTQSPQPDPPLGPVVEELSREERAQSSCVSSTGATSSTDPDPDPDVTMLPSGGVPNGPWDDGEEAILSSSNGDCDIALDLSLAKAPADDDMDEEMAEMAFYDDEDGQSSSPGMETVNGGETSSPNPPLVRTPSSGGGPPPDLKDETGHSKEGPPTLYRGPPLVSLHGPLPAHCSPSAAATPLIHSNDAMRQGALALSDSMGGEQGRLCPVCHKVFRFEKNLYRHMQKAHAAGDGESVLKCKLCNYTTKHYSNMYVHIRTHTGDKPYWCSACGASFTQGSSLKLHIRSRHQENMSFFSLTKKYGKNNLTKLWTRVLKKDLPKFTSPFNHNAAAAAAAAAVLENAKAMGHNQVAAAAGGASFFFPTGYGNASGLPPFSYFSPVAAAAAAAAASGIVFPNGASPGPNTGHPPPPPPPQPFFLGPPPPPPPPPAVSVKSESLGHSPVGVKAEPGLMGPFESDNPPPLGVLNVKAPPPPPPASLSQQQPPAMTSMAPGCGPPHHPPPPPPTFSLSGAHAGVSVSASHLPDSPSAIASSQSSLFPSSPFFNSSTSGLLPVGHSPFLNHSSRHLLNAAAAAAAAVNGGGGTRPLNGCATPGLVSSTNASNNNNNNNNNSGTPVLCPAGCTGVCACSNESGPEMAKIDKSLQVGLAESAAIAALRQEQELLNGKLDRLRDSAKRLLLSLYSRSLASASAVRELRGEKIDDLMEHAAKTASSLETAAVTVTQAYD